MARPHSCCAAAAAAARVPQEFKGYVFKIMGGQDKQGFPMKQGVLTNGRVQVRVCACARAWLHVCMVAARRVPHVAAMLPPCPCSGAAL